MALRTLEKDSLENFDPFGPAFRADPEPFHQRLLQTSPGFMTLEGVPSAYVARYAQATEVLRDFKSFSSLKPKGLPGMERIDFFNGLPVMNYSDPPDHTRRRRVVNPAFNPRRTELLMTEARTQIDRVLDKAAETGRFDAVQELAKPLSIETLLDRFLMVTDKDAQQIFFDYFASVPLLDKMKPGDPKPQPFLDVWARGQAYCLDQLELSRHGKADSLIGVIASSVLDGTLNEDEMMAMMIVLLIGGVATVSGAIGSSLRFLAADPDLADRIRDDPELAARHLEEALRIDSPVSLVMRFGAETSVIDGVPIPKDMPVYVMLSSANRDPTVFERPDEFNIDRPNVKEHVAFGQGVHTCIGNTVTRTLVPEVIRRVAGRFRHIRIAEGVPNAVHFNSSNPRARHLENLILDVR
jgi:cytochrome P450